MAACVIDSGKLYDCANPELAGLWNYIIAYNLTDWRTIVESGGVTKTGNVITNIVNPLGVQAYRFDVADSTGLVATYPVRKVGGGINGYDHMINVNLLGNDQAIKDTLHAMLITGVVVIVMGRNGKAELYGERYGLFAQNNTASRNDSALGGVLPVELASDPDTAAEPRAPIDIFDTDAATTRALIDGLLVAGV